VVLSPAWATTPRPPGFAPNPCSGWIPGGPEPALSGRDGARSGQGVQAPPPTDAPPTRARQGQRVRTTIRRGQARYGTGLIGLKNLRPWSEKPEAVVSIS
jgi:hypothetical protein